MCGLVGFIDRTTICSNEQKISTLKKMSETLFKRGPDDFGEWSDSNAQVYFGFRRLAILDLSSAGHQPMISRTSRYKIVFNGEIYNHLELRSELGINDWNGHSDTETILATFEKWGIEEATKKLVGMFAFVVFDSLSNTLTLGRDRAGEKPLYYGFQGKENTFIFGSELKALKLHPAFENKIDRGALSLFLRYSYIPAPYSIYKGISKLLPGTLLVIDLENFKTKEIVYWSSTKKALELALNPSTDTTEQAIENLDRLLRQAVSGQMISDVPLGAFLSGGIDSTTVVALMQAQSAQKIKTFTIGFQDKAYNEALFASEVAKHLGTDHTELYVTPTEALNVIPRLPDMYDEPFADSSQIPTFLVAELAKKSVTVALSGDAGDEIFGGYNRYQLGAELWPKIEMIPKPVRSLLSKSIRNVSPESWNRLGEKVEKVIPSKKRLSNFGDKLYKGASFIGADSIDDLYFSLLGHWQNPESVVLYGIEPETFFKNSAKQLGSLDSIQKMMILDFQGYLPDDILVKVDRASMAVSLESRVPFLDHRVVEYAWNLPLSLKLRDGQTKWILRQVLYKYVPQAMIERPKKGFSIPIDSWLRTELREWAENLLNENRLKEEGFFQEKLIRKTWEEHLSGQKNWSTQLWNVLMFQAWLDKQKQ